MRSFQYIEVGDGRQKSEKINLETLKCVIILTSACP